MKKNILFLFFICGFYTMISQTKVPQLVSFSAVVRNANNTPLANTPVSLRLTFRKLGQNGPIVYCALHQQTSNANGYITIQLNRQVIGTACNGAPSTAFENIPWEEGGFWMDVEYQTTPTTPFVSLGQLELASTFYAFVSKYAENVKGLSLSSAKNNDVLTFDSTINTWIGKTISNMAGAQGPAGAQGVQGPKGDTGIQGPAGLLPNGSSAGNTAFWNGSSWVVNNSNIHNNGSTVGIGTSSPSTSAKLEIASTTQGFLPPRMTTSQRNTIVSPSAGLTIYNTTENCLQWWNGNVWFDGCGNNPHLLYPTGSAFCTSGATAIVDVTNPATGKTWMDRNLGASRAAISSNDSLAYGDLYQWGRRNDGHQCRTSSTISTLSSVTQPAHGSFILSANAPVDWLSSQNNNLWQGVNGINNPCPNGYRLPSEAELLAEINTWTWPPCEGAFNSPLKLPTAGLRSSSDGTIVFYACNGYYWTQTINSQVARGLIYDGSGKVIIDVSRAEGYSVRCIKN
jgi:hypothetical protein